MKDWTIIFNNYKPEEESLRESLCTLGNGYFATRGAGEESSDDGIHYPGTYLAGGYNRLKSYIAGETIENEDFVNWPNWLPLNFMPEGGEWFNLDKGEVVDYQQTLNLMEGFLQRNILFRDHEYRETQIISKRIVHIEEPHKAAIQWKIIPINWSGRIMVKSAIDGTVINNGVKRYASLNQKHLESLSTGSIGSDGIYLTAKTVQSQIKIAVAAKTTVVFNDKPINVQRRLHEKEGLVSQILQFQVDKGKEYIIEKIVEINTSKDNAISEPQHEVIKNIQRAKDFSTHYKTHCDAWKIIWERCDTLMEIEGEDEYQLALRLHIFHLMQTLSKNIMDLDVGAPSRGLHGEAYRGHIFWDELFIFPLLNFTYPEVTRELLMYRFRRLPEARHQAKKAGYRGAMFPWQSGSDGREESQIIHLNPKSGRWLPDHTYLQRHVNAAIAYNVWQYYQVTNDKGFLSFYGAEIFLDIASFWASKVEYNPIKNKYEIKNIVGPDEYHTSYPNSAQPGINNNAYTNIMAIWTLITAQKILKILHDDRKNELLIKLGISDQDLEKWNDITYKMFIPMLSDGVIEQFEGFDNLKELNWEKYRSKHASSLRLDRVLESENDDVNKYKACKQADVLMLFYLLSEQDLKLIFSRLGYQLPKEFLHKNIDYYDKRSSHGSTLSKLVHSWVTAQSNREKSWNSLKDALMSDLRDVQGGTTAEGIHLGAMAGSIDIVQRCYSGLEVKDNLLYFNPDMPKNIKRIVTKLHYRGELLEVIITHNKFTIKSIGGWNGNINILFQGRQYELKRGDVKVWDL